MTPAPVTPDTPLRLDYRKPAMTTPTQLVYRPDEARVILRISRATIWRRIASGELPSRKLGRITLIPADALKPFLTSAQEAPNTTGLQRTMAVEDPGPQPDCKYPPQHPKPRTRNGRSLNETARAGLRRKSKSGQRVGGQK